MDDVVEIKRTVEEINYLKPPQEQVEDKAQEARLSWLRNDFGRVLADLNRESVMRSGAEGVDVAIRFAKLMNELTETLDTFVEDGSYKTRCGELNEIIFGDSKDSIVNCMGRSNREMVARQLIGPISVLTFWDLLKKARPDLTKGVRISRILTSAQEDVEDKVDIALRFGDKNEAGKEMVRLIQLKAKGTKKPKIYLTNDPIPIDIISSRDVEKIEEKARLMEKELGVEVKTYVVTVPSYDDVTIKNIFGIIQKKHNEREKISHDFGNEAEGCELLPARQQR